VAVGRPANPSNTKQGVIRFLWYERGQRTVGQALLDAAERHLREQGIGEVQAFPQEYRYPFYHLKAAYLSDHMDHVGALLAFNGYRRIRGEVFLDWPDYAPDAPSAVDIPVETSIEWRPGRGRFPGIKVRAYLDGRPIGGCECVSCGEYTHADEAQDWLFTTSLGLDEDSQGKGIGKYLLRTSLQAMHGVGYRHATISTAWDNHRAFLFYSNFGYRLSEWTHGYGRTLPVTH
jgi:GNAT superfamily N-acetyltransferase